jgi:Tfp pilus assembly protein PilV
MALEKSNFSQCSSARGFSLVETIVSMGILATALIAMAQLFTLATTQNLSARATTSATILARQKVEQLRSLTWGFDADVLPVSDFSSDTTTNPPVPNGGTGLSASATNSLEQNTVGYVDYIGREGQSLGTAATPPPGTVYVRRWSIEPLPTNPNNTLILQVLVYRVNARAGTGDDVWLRRPDEARITTIKTRKAM